MTAPAPTAPWRMCTVHQILTPTDRLIPAACHQVGCLKWRRGWDVLIPEATEQGARHAAAIRSGKTGRTYRELPATADGMTVFRFDSGQRCFAEHKTRPELYVVHNEAGRARGQRRREKVPGFWAESLHETQDRRLAARQRG